MKNLVKVIMLTSVLALSVSVQAQESSSPAVTEETSPPAKVQAQALQQQAQTLQQKIGNIQQKALQANPELEERRAELDKMILDAMKEQGASPQQDIERLDEIKQQINQPGLTRDEQMQMVQEAQAIQTRLQQVQQQVLQEQSVREVQEAFLDDLMIAMKDENANTESLVQDLQQVVQQLRKQQMVQQQQNQ